MDHLHEAMAAFMPHGMCYLWQPGIITAQVVSNGLIALAYYMIPVLLLILVGRRPDVPNPLLFTLFAVFILACGTTHVMKIVTIWHPVYWTSTFVDAVTAAASVGTAAVMVPLMPKLLKVGSVEAYLETVSRSVLEDKNAALEAANKRLERTNADLAEQMALMERSATLLAERESRIEELRQHIARLQEQLGGSRSTGEAHG